MQPTIFIVGKRKTLKPTATVSTVFHSAGIYKSSAFGDQIGKDVFKRKY